MVGLAGLVAVTLVMLALSLLLNTKAQRGKPYTPNHPPALE